MDKYLPTLAYQLIEPGHECVEDLSGENILSQLMTAVSRKNQIDLVVPCIPIRANECSSFLECPTKMCYIVLMG